MKKIDVKLLAKHENQYIATSSDSDTVLASGKTIKEVEKKLEKNRIKEAIIGFIPPINKAVSPLCQ